MICGTVGFVCLFCFPFSLYFLCWLMFMLLVKLLSPLSLHYRSIYDFIRAPHSSCQQPWALLTISRQWWTTWGTLVNYNGISIPTAQWYYDCGDFLAPHARPPICFWWWECKQSTVLTVTQKQSRVWNLCPWGVERENHTVRVRASCTVSSRLCVMLALPKAERVTVLLARSALKCGCGTSLLIRGPNSEL